MTTESKFWRLLGEYERLTEDETTALRELNFPAIGAIQDKKREFLEKLVAIGGQCGLDARHPEVAKRLTLLSEAQRRNAAFVSDFLAKRRGEVDSLKQVSGRLRFFRAAYSGGSGQEAGKSLFVRG